MKYQRRSRRRGAVMVLFVLALVPILCFVALAVDLGLFAVARTQTQNAADSAAMAATRALNGDSTSNNNYAGAAPAAQQAVSANKVLAAPIAAGQVSVDVGRFTYVSGSQRFEGQFPGPSTENWSMVRATVSSDVSSSLGFSKALTFSPPTIQAVATAAHRPRDVAVILDFSGSMRFASLLGQPYSGSRASNNPDSIYPQFGAYSSSAATLQATSFAAPYDEANITTTTSDGRPPICQDFYTNSTGTAAFSSASSGYATTPGGDNYLKQNFNTSSTYATTVAAVLNLSTVTNSTRDATFETNGYQSYSMNGSYLGYTVGPGYWGKTFFIWPPDPRTAWDWRRRFFTFSGLAAGEPVDNRDLWDSSGNWREPDDYDINYDAILAWIKSGPQVFPTRMQSGRILYYDAIPDHIDTSTWPPTDQNQRFWKDYIDYVLGLKHSGGNSWTVIASGTGSSCAKTGYGADFSWGTRQITNSSSLVATGSPAKKPYMHYLDNPRRPRTHFWFGPMTMVDFLGNYNLWSYSSSGMRYCYWPGTCHESPMYACKLGMRGALQDIRNNHPNDLVSLIFFSTPSTGANEYDGRFNRVRVGLSRDYDRMNESLWYPPSTLGNSSATVRPYDANNVEVPRAYGGTCYSMPLMLAFNQFSENSSLKTYNSSEATGDAGGNGRRGAQKIVIFETDGMPNTLASANLVNGGAYQSYYAVRYNSGNPGSSEYPNNVDGTSDNSSSVVSQILGICQKICALDTATPAGYSSTSKPVQIHCLGFGPIFEDNETAADALDTLNQMQQTSGINDGMPSYKVITGNESQMISRLQTAFTKILQTGVQVSLIQ